MRVTGFNHIGINAAGKEQETRNFYLSLLGLNDIPRAGAANQVAGFWTGTDHPFVHVIADPPAEGLEMPFGTHLSLFVDDIDAAVAEIKERGGDILHLGEGDSQIIWCKDPAGNTVEFQQDPSIAPG